MKLALVHARAATVELARYPSFSVPTLLFPTLIFLAFGRRTGLPTDLGMACYAAFAVLGVAFFQFGVGIAAERASPWQTFLRILPVGPAVRFAARIVSALAFALTSAALVVAAAVAVTDVSLPASRWLALASTLLTGAIPFALLGIAIGYWTTPRGALPLANLLFLALSYAGGLLAGREHIPEELRRVAEALPTRLWGELLAASVGAGAWPLASALGLAAYGCAFTLLAGWGYNRDEGERFR